jgi:hypothetical protein
VTAQIHECLIFDGKETSMAFCPPLPKRHSRVTENTGEPNEEDFILRSTACWRRYQGTWEVREGLIYLKSLAGRFALIGSEPLFAEWFSGVLRVPRGEVLEHVHMGFGSVYEEELHVKIKRGVVVETRVIDNRAKNHDQRLLGWKNIPGFENRFDGDDRTPGIGPFLARWLRRVFG